MENMIAKENGASQELIVGASKQRAALGALMPLQRDGAVEERRKSQSRDGTARDCTVEAVLMRAAVQTVARKSWESETEAV